jgi:hypothetical protein
MTTLICDSNFTTLRHPVMDRLISLATKDISTHVVIRSRNEGVVHQSNELVHLIIMLLLNHELEGDLSIFFRPDSA